MANKKLFFRNTDRLQIRTLNEKDYSAWKTAYASYPSPKNIWDQTKSRPLSELTRAKFRTLLKDQTQKRKSEDFCDYSIFLKETGEMIGRASLMNFVRSVTQSAFVGYALFNPYWGKGYAEEAVRALLDIAFKDHKLHRVVAGIEPSNKKSLRLVKKLSFRKEGLSKRVVFLRGKWRDLIQYALTSEDLNIKWTGSAPIRKR